MHSMVAIAHVVFRSAQWNELLAVSPNVRLSKLLQLRHHAQYITVLSKVV